MFQIDNPSASPTLPPATSAGTPGYFTDGSPSAGVDPTILPAEFLNIVMLELINIVSISGIAPSKASNTQVAQAIRRLMQKTVVLTDVGTTNTYSAANTPALVAADMVSGLVQRVSILTANTGAATYAPDGLAAKPVLGMGLAPLQGGELPLKGIATLMYVISSNVNGGNGGWVLIECTGGTQQVADATQSKHAVSLGQADAKYTQSLQANGITTMTNTGLLATSVFGGTVIANSASAIALTLPAASSGAAGKRIELLNIGAGLVSLLRSGSDTITATSLTLGSGDTITVESNGVNGWYAVSGSAQLGSTSSFGSLMGANGFQKLPSGLIWQWGTLVLASGVSDVTLPVNYNNLNYRIFPTVMSPSGSAFPGTAAEVNISSRTTSKMSLAAYQSNGTIAAGATVQWQSVGN